MLFLTQTLTLTLFLKRNKTPLFTEQKRTYWEAMLQGRGWGRRRPMQANTIIQATSKSATAETIEDILSGTMPPKEGFGWVISLIISLIYVY